MPNLEEVKCLAGKLYRQGIAMTMSDAMEKANDILEVEERQKPFFVSCTAPEENKIDMDDCIPKFENMAADAEKAEEDIDLTKETKTVKELMDELE